MQIYACDHVEVHPQKKKEVLYLAKKEKEHVCSMTKNRLEIYILSFHNTDAP